MTKRTKENKMKRVIGFLMLLVCLSTSTAIMAQTSGLRYILRDGGNTYMVVKGTMKDKEVVIPETYNSIPVQIIGNNGFEGCDMTSVSIPNSVTKIGEMAFWNCRNLKSIHIPSSVSSIGKRAFDGCKSLESITVDHNNQTYIGEGNCIVKRDDSVLVYGILNTKIPNRVLSISDFAFYGSNITSIAIPSSVTSIGEYAFCNSSLKSITIVNGVTQIGNNAFLHCQDIGTITIPNSVTSIGERVFWNCKNMKSIYIPSSVLSIGPGSFNHCPDLVIYSGHTNKPAGWASDWNPLNRPVRWGATGIPR